MAKSDNSGTSLSSAIISILIAVIFLCRGCWVADEEGVYTLQTLGFDNIKVEEKDWFAVGLRGCSSTDAAKFEAVVVNSNGITIKVLVCTGWPFKGATVRYPHNAGTNVPHTEDITQKRERAQLHEEQEFIFPVEVGRLK